MPTRRRRAARAANPKTLADLRPDPHNARRHTERNLQMVDDSLSEVGAARSIVIDEKGVVLAGNATAEVARRKGLKLHVVDVDGGTLVAVRRRGLSKEAKTRLALFDNRAAELAEWDDDALQKLQAADVNLSGLFDDAELAMLRGSVEAETGPVQPTAIARPQDVAWVLLAIPVEDWPQHQGAVERLQLASKFSTMVLRPKAKK